MPDAERMEMINGMPADEWRRRFNDDGSRKEPAKPAAKTAAPKRTVMKKPAPKAASEPKPAVPDEGVKADEA